MLRLLPLAFLLFLAGCVVLAGCDSGTEFPALRAPGGQTPVAGAIEFRGVNNEFLGVIGSGPVGGFLGDAPPSGRVGFLGVYPNPTRGRTSIAFSFQEATEASIFIVAALPPGSVPPFQASNTQGAWVYRPGGLPNAVFAQRTFEAGQHTLDVEFFDVGSRPLPVNYYRVYVQTPDFIAWQDILYDPTLPPF